MVSVPRQIRRRGMRCDVSVQPRMEPDQAEQLSADLKALAHPVRLQILDVLASHGGEVCVCDIEAALPVRQPTVSHHLKILRETGLIDCIRRGLWAYYFVRRDRVDEVHARLSELISLLREGTAGGTGGRSGT